MKYAIGFFVLGLCVFSVRGEVPGEFRPRPVLPPTEADATQAELQPAFKSRAPLTQPRRIPKLAEQPPPAQSGNELIFNAGWEMIEAFRIHAGGATLSLPGVDTRQWYDATVPGTILTTLINEGVYPDPYFGLNNLAIPEILNKRDYWYRTEFIMPVAFAGHEITLQFNGINYYAEAWFNGHYLGHITGAFTRGIFDVTKIARPDARNVLAVMVAPPPDPNALGLDGPTFICSQGTDWLPPIHDRCTGIWRDVILRATGPVTVEDPQVITTVAGDLLRADVTINAEIHNGATTSEQGTLTAAIEDVEISRRVALQPGERKIISFTPQEFPQLSIAHPRLWWPNGYGKSELYQLQLSFQTADGMASDSQQSRFGIRQLTYDSKDATNLVIRVNGKRILCLGGVWGMDDAMKNVSLAELEPFIRLQRDANLNMIRNWCGQSTSEAFYDLCDEYGMLVWNDFWMETGKRTAAPHDQNSFLRSVADTIKRYRNHPSIALWCAMGGGIAPDSINHGDQKLVRQLDGTRLYLAGSPPIISHSRSTDLSGSFTNWNHGFSTERDDGSIPPASLIALMMAPADSWPPADVWTYHDFAVNGSPLFQRIAQCFGSPHDLPDFCRKAQMLDYETARAAYEGFNSRMWKDGSGLLVWNHPSWPTFAGQFYSWNDEPNAALFGTKKAAEPIHIQMNLPDCKVIVVNHTSTSVAGATATAAIYNLSAGLDHADNATVSVDPNSATDAFILNWPLSGAHFVRLELRDKAGQLLSENFYWHGRKPEDLQELNTLPAATLEGAVSINTNSTVTFRLANTGKVPALSLRLALFNTSARRQILPAYFGDDFFSLLPGESRLVQIETRDLLPNAVGVSVNGWNVPEQMFGSQ